MSSLGAYVLRLFLFLNLIQHTHRVNALLGHLCLLCLSHSFYRSCSRSIHLRGYSSTSSSFHAYMHCECTRIRYMSGNEHAIKEKKVFYFFFTFLTSFSSLFFFYFNFPIGVQMVLFSHSVQKRILFSVTYSFISKTLHHNDCCFIYVQYCSGSNRNGFFSFSSSFVSFDYSSVVSLILLLHLCKEKALR